MPVRNAPLGFLLYYATLAASIAACVLVVETGSGAAYLAAALGFACLLAQDVAWWHRYRIDPADREFINRLCEWAAGDQADKLLRRTDFALHIINDRALLPLVTLSQDWVGVDYQFSRRRYQAWWLELQSRAGALLALLQQHAKYMNASNFGVPDKSQAEIANRLAADMFRLVECFRAERIERMQP